MAQSKPFRNPFYVALVVAGVAFLLTAFCYGLMAYREMSAGSAGHADSGLLAFLEEHGIWLLIGELAVLVVASMAAMATDHLWNKKPDTSSPDELADDQGSEP